MDNLFRDIRYALRSLRKTPVFTLAALGAVTIGIGANAAIFSVVNQVLLKPLPYPDPSQIMLLPFTTQEDRPSSGHVVILSYGVWQRRFGGDDNIVGRSLALGGVPYEIVGVVGRDFNTELNSPPDVFLPFQIDPASADHAQYFSVVARLRAGVSIPIAKAKLQLAADAFRRKFPNIFGAKDSFGIQPFQDAIVTDAKSPLVLFTGAVVFVLLIACANVANLLLIRGTSRKREVAIRSAVGAGRGRIVRQLLTESLVMSTIGGVFGLAFGIFGVRALIAMNPGNIPRIGLHGSAIGIDWRVLLFTVIISLLTGVLFGLVPAFGISREDFGIALREGGGRSGSSYRQKQTRSLLVASETALALILLIGAGLLIRSFFKVRTVNRGIDTHQVLTLRTSLAGRQLVTSSEVGQFVRQTAQRLENLPGVQIACASYSLPLEGAFGIPFNIVGRATTDRYDGRGWLAVSPGYFGTFNVPLLRGRAFSHGDDSAGAPVAIINQELAHRFWQKGNPIGNRILLGQNYGPEFKDSAREIVGVVGDVLDFGSKTPQPVVYIPVAQVPDGITALLARVSSLAWIVRTRVEPHSLEPAIQKVLQHAAGSIAITKVRSMDDVVVGDTAAERFQMTVLTVSHSPHFCSQLLGCMG